MISTVCLKPDSNNKKTMFSHTNISIKQWFHNDLNASNGNAIEALCTYLVKISYQLFALHYQRSTFDFIFWIQFTGNKATETQIPPPLIEVLHVGFPWNIICSVGCASIVFSWLIL